MNYCAQMTVRVVECLHSSQLRGNSAAASLATLLNSRLVRWLVAILIAVVATSSHAADLEPRYRWKVNVGSVGGYFDSTEEAFLAYKAWEDANNESQPGTANDIFVLGYEPQTVATINGVVRGYEFRYRRESTCPETCVGNSMGLSIECPVGTTQVRIDESATVGWIYCAEPTRPEPDCDDCSELGNPIHPLTGLKRQVETDYQAADGTLRFVRTYRSDRNDWRHNYQVAATDVSSSLGTPSLAGGSCRPGIGQSSDEPYCFRYISRGSPSDIVLRRADGRVVYFDKTTGLPTSANVNERMTAVLDGAGTLIGWDIRDGRNDRVQRLSPSGQLQMIIYRDGRTEALAYSNATTPATIAPFAGLLISVSDHNGRQLTFTYDAQGRMTTMTDPSGGVYTYAYDEPSSIVRAGELPVGNLTSVTYPDQTKRIYWYNEQDKTASTNLPFALTGITDENTNRYAIYKYNQPGRAVSTEHAGGVEKYSFVYSASASYTNVTDPLGTERRHTFTTVLGLAKNTSINQPCTGATCGGNPAAATTYDANGNVASRTDFKSQKTCYSYDLARNLEIFRLEGLASGVSCPANLSSYVPAVGTRQRKIATQWHANYRLPTQIDEPGKRTTFTHDASGNVLTRTELDTATSEVRTWTYTYNSAGRVLTADGPRADVSDVTTYTYYTCTTGYQCGQVHTATNATGHVTTFNTYNAHGQPLTITDPNAVVTTLTYDLRQRLTSRTVGTETTAFAYWPTGLLKKVTLPDGTYIEYSYDAAHRLTDINDAEGNRIHYALDLMGNRTGEQAYDPSNALTRTRTRVFNALNRLYQEIGAAGTANVATTFGYDNNGNQTSIVAPLGRDAVQAYDELNRLKQVTDPLNGVTQYGYNALDQLISVTDPRGLVTSYQYNALGNLNQQTSPDTGVTTNTYDSGGNLATSTDARGAVTTYTYDAINRVASTSFSSGSTTDPTLSYAYDGGTFGKGQLTGISDSNHSLSWAHDEQGRVLSATQVVGSISKITSYTYANGLRQSVTTPSGQVISYGYTNGKVTSVSVNGTVVVSNILYDPFGPVRQWTWADSSLAVRTFDQDGNIALIDSAGLKTYGYDDAFRITGITDTTNSALSWTYGYDDLDRLTSASKTSTTLGYTYDANGNRLTETGSSPSTFTVAANSNRLSSTSGTLARAYGYDAAGNTTSFTGVSFTYNNRGRMSSSTKSGITTSYVYNAIGQLIQKGASTLYYYDDAGHILGIYDGGGALKEEIVWLGDTPIATLRPQSGGGVSIYNIHTDHLNTPRTITDSISGAVRWRWDGEPFGDGAADDDPSGAGAFQFDLRFPGQIAMAETGLNYNYFRDYDPSTGRYAQSDPIGLGGGINLYAYANGDPVHYIDPTGENPLWGALAGAGIDIAVQLAFNGGRIECIKWDVVLIAAATGAFNPFSSLSAAGKVLKGEKMAARAANLRAGSRAAKKTRQRGAKHYRNGGREFSSWAGVEGVAEGLGNIIPDEKHWRFGDTECDPCGK